MATWISIRVPRQRQIGSSEDKALLIAGDTPCSQFVLGEAPAMIKR